MRTLIFSVLLALCIIFVRAGGEEYEVTWYGGEEDNNMELKPFCGTSRKDKRPETEYYAAVSRSYDYDLCNSYAIVMGVDPYNSKRGNMIKVKIVDSCRECTRSHIDMSKKAFVHIGESGKGRFKIIWIGLDSKGRVTRDVVYPSSATETFAKKVYGLSKERFVNMFVKQAKKMVANSETHGYFDKYDVPKTTTTTRKTTVVAAATATVEATNAPVIEETDAPIAGVGEVNIITGETDDDAIPEAAPIVGQSKADDDYYDEKELNELEKGINEDENSEDSYTVGILSAALSVSGAAGIGLLYLKKQSPGKYEELKQKFPEAFDNIKRSVSRSATSIRRGATSIRRGVTRTATSMRGRNKTPAVSRHGDHTGINYREMPEHMFGEDGLPRIELHDEPMNTFPEATIRLE